MRNMFTILLVPSFINVFHKKCLKYVLSLFVIKTLILIFRNFYFNNNYFNNSFFLIHLFIQTFCHPFQKFFLGALCWILSWVLRDTAGRRAVNLFFLGAERQKYELQDNMKS